MGFKEFIRPNLWKAAFVILFLIILIFFIGARLQFCSLNYCAQPPQDYRVLSLFSQCPCGYVSIGEVLTEYAVLLIASIIFYFIASLIGAAISAIKPKARL